MRRAEGCYRIFDPDARREVTEVDTIQCTHCGGHFSMTPKADPTLAHGWCGRCAHFICRDCADEMDRTLTCRPFEARLLAAEARDRLRRAVTG